MLAVWLWKAEPRRWVRNLGVISFCAVVFQGVLGGLRVILLRSEIGIFHACFAQAFFCLVISIAFFTSKWWTSNQPQPDSRASFLRKACLITTTVIFCQLALGATMRHTQSGLAVPDFPLAYGKILPPSAGELDQVNSARASQYHLDPVTLGQIGIHYSHRVGAIVVTGCILGLAALILAQFREQRSLLFLAISLFLLLSLQILLGAWTVLSEKAADVATAHVAVGALILAASFSATLVSLKLFAAAPQENTSHSVLSPQPSALR